MAENKMKEVAELLGVEIGKPFNIKGRNFNPYTLTNDGLCDITGYYNEYILLCLLKGEYEIEQSILTEKEKRYLEGVLSPFKDRVVYVCKHFCNPKEEFIGFGIRNVEWTPFPSFKKDTMYKGMELDRRYTLEELGLFQD